MTHQSIHTLLRQKLRFAATGGVATVVDYTIYLSLVNRVLTPVWAQVAAYSISVIVNFTLQRWFVFDLRRSLRSAFGWSLLVSAGGLLLSTGLIYLLNLYPFFQEHQLITKILTSGLIFFYNFYCKRYVFEKRFI
ncbi:MAG: GtrA family protein [Bacteroidetes bacterium]|nr:MAG: GtrA family protein [Bacteroidota bacterium]